MVNTENQIDYILCSQRWRSSIQSANARSGANCSYDHEILIAKFRLKLKNVGKTIRPFRYDLNQIPYGYTVEVTNRFKGLNLIDGVPEELWMEVCNIVEEVVIKNIPKKKKCKKAKWLSEEAVQTAEKRREVKGKEKGESESERHAVLSDSVTPCTIYRPWDSPGQNTGVGSLSLLQGIFPAQGSNPGLPH